MKPLIGRNEPLKRLQSYLDSPKSEFIAVYGRRRVGKTFLVRKAFDSKFTFQFTGLANVNMSTQLAQFHVAMINTAPNIIQTIPPKNWFEAFNRLIKLIESQDDSRNESKKKTIFLDELPWMDSQNSKFLSALEHFWNGWASARADILLIVCGSAASWMVNNLIRNKGGLHNRVTDKIKLNPFTLAESENFLREMHVVEDRYQTLLVYMVFGGIPFYLERINSGKSAMQNINDLCFQQDAPFQEEFDIVYASLFNKHERHVSIIEALAKKGKGLSRKEIVQATNLTDGGGLTRILRELEESNFIRKYKLFESKENLYQLIDLYSLFYLRFIKRMDKTDELFWINKIDSPSFYSWAGYSFEMVCLLHVPQIKKALGISGVQTKVSTWRSSNAQIDLVIDRKDHVINICEMKFSIAPFTIDKKYSENLVNKLSSFRDSTKTRKALFLTLITTYGPASKKYWGMIQNSLEMDVLFE